MCQRGQLQAFPCTSTVRAACNAQRQALSGERTSCSVAVPLLEPRLDVKIDPDLLLRVNPPRDVEPDQPVHERRAHARATQRPARLGEVFARASPAEIGK